MTTVSSPSRMPFGILDESRLRNLTNIKNQQNAILPPTSSLGKRRYEPDADPAFDAENVDPSAFSKKAKNDSNDFSKPQHFVLKPTTVGPCLTPTTRQTITPKRLAKKSVEIKPVSFSAPAGPTAPAGRSPTRKRAGILNRRTSGSSFTRVDPPSFSLGRKGISSLPFSIDSALSSMVRSRVNQPAKVATHDTVMTLDDNPPSSWVFDIHEDTADEELGNLMQHSTQVLDLSDDEDRKARLLAEIGKENIAPPEYTGRQRAIARRDMMSDEARTPLGDLKPEDFYADGCDANSYIIVGAGKEEKLAINVETVPDFAAAKPTITTPSPTEAGSANQDELRDLFAYVDAQVTEDPAIPGLAPLHAPEVEPLTIDIWESESAQGDEPEVHDAVTTTTSLEDSLAAVTAHEEAAIEAAV